ncbi:MAG: 8-oxo-dGTP diphosphatase [Alphaproteobacteria bacterium]|nr:8-oxo-dGTP diphosphatase [Alphaproteobacteria bacterium]
MKKIPVTLLFVIKENRILLALKKCGWRAGIYNGLGGKVEHGETDEQAMVREAQEEAGITPVKYEKVAINNYEVYFKGELSNMIVHIYTASEFKGELTESDEMKPEWFDIDKIPYDRMWSNDVIWIPKVLNGEKFEGHFVMDKDNNLLSHRIEPRTNFSR